jgi:hypothetical protein
MAEQPIMAVLHQQSVDADPTPDPTPEEAKRLRVQLAADVAKWKAAGNEEAAKASQKRLDALGTDATVETETAEEEGYDGWTNEELSAELEARGLTKSGAKAEMVARLQENDAEAKG